MIFLPVNMCIDNHYPISKEYLCIQKWVKEEKKDKDTNQKKDLGYVLPKYK